MAAAALVLGGMIGFLTALAGWAIFDLTAVQILGLWSGGGMLASAVLTLIGQSLQGPAAKSGKGPVSRAHA
jgi:hypothetical protein